MMHRIAVWGVASLFALSLAQAKDLHVPRDFPTIQAALTAAEAGDAVIVADGVYSGAGNRGLFFGGKGVTLRSENGAGACILDAEQSGTAFWMVAFEPPEALIEGFTIINGAGGSGGAAFIHHDSRPTFVNCVFSNNGTDFGSGGAVHCDTASHPTFVHCTFSNNKAARGGALDIVDRSSATIIDCLFHDNSATGQGGAIFFTGPALNVSNSTFARNSAAESGAIHNLSSAGTASLTDCIVWSNGSIALGGPGDFVVTFSDVEGGWPGMGNIDGDPRFAAGPDGDFYLGQKAAGQQKNSPCVNAGSGAAKAQQLKNRTTRVDEGKDRGIVDLGFHYPR